MTRREQDASDLRPFLALMPGFAPRDDQNAGADGMDAAAKGAGLRSAAALVQAGNDNPPTPTHPVACSAPAPVVPINTPGVSTTQAKPANSRPHGNFFFMSGGDVALQHIQEKLGLPADCYRASGPNSVCMRAWRLPSNYPARSLARAVMGAGASGFGTTAKLDRRFTAFGARAGEPLPASLIARLQS